MATTGAASNYLESAIRSHIFRGVTFTPSGTLAIGLTSNIPTDASTGASCFEIPNQYNYARQTITSSASNWSADSATDGKTYNNVQITFPAAAGGAWGNISGIVITDTSVYGAGNVYVYGALTAAKFINDTDQFIIDTSGIYIQFD